MTGPVAPNELERLLVVAANDPAERPAFAQALLAHDVYALGRSDPPSVNGLIPPGAKVGFASLKDAHGPMVPFFTSRERLEAALAAWPGADPSFFCLTGRSFLELTRGSRLVLNPIADHGKYYAPNEVAALLDGSQSGLEKVEITEPQQFLVGAPRVVPPELRPTLTRFFAQRPAVEAAHLAWSASPDGHQGYLLAIVSADPEAAIDGLGLLELQRLTEGASLDVRIFAPGTEDATLSASPPPFYVRQRCPDSADP